MSQIVSFENRHNRFFVDNYGMHIVDLGTFGKPYYLGVKYGRDDSILTLPSYTIDWRKLSLSRIKSSPYSKLSLIPTLGDGIIMFLSEFRTDSTIRIVKNIFELDGVMCGDLHTISLCGYAASEIDEDEFVDEISYKPALRNIDLICYLFYDLLEDKKSKVTSYKGKDQIKRKMSSLGLPYLLSTYEQDMNVKLFD